MESSYPSTTKEWRDAAVAASQNNSTPAPRMSLGYKMAWERTSGDPSVSGVSSSVALRSTLTSNQRLLRSHPATLLWVIWRNYRSITLDRQGMQRCSGVARTHHMHGSLNLTYQRFVSVRIGPTSVLLTLMSFVDTSSQMHRQDQERIPLFSHGHRRTNGPIGNDVRVGGTVSTPPLTDQCRAAECGLRETSSTSLTNDDVHPQWRISGSFRSGSCSARPSAHPINPAAAAAASARNDRTSKCAP